MEELHDLLRERRTAGDADADPPAEAVAHLLEHECVGDAPLQCEVERHALAALDVPARAVADGQRPVDQLLLDAGLLRELLQNGRVHFLVHARHARQDRRPHREQRLGCAQRVGEERDRVAHVRA